MTQTASPTAAVIMIGDEVLSGRTRDSNLQTIANALSEIGVAVVEARVVGDVQEQIVDAVQTLSAACDYVFTTGGIGPTHDDITADAVGAAFGRKVDVRDDARRILEDWYAARETQVNEARLRMARIPEGADLIANPVSGAPGFRLENVHVFAGVPRIMAGMLACVIPTLKGGTSVISRTLHVPGLREGDFAAPLREVAELMSDISFGSYPGGHVEDRPFVNLVVRGTDVARLDEAVDALTQRCTGMGLNPKELDLA